MKRRVHCLVFEGMADWEPAYLLPELRVGAGFEVVTVGLGSSPFTTRGGFEVMAAAALEDIDGSDLLVLPGGDRWEHVPSDEPLLLKLRELERAGVPLAGICGGTLPLARAGLLDLRSHTSNHAGYLERHAPAYRGAARYRNAPAVEDRGVVTASGAAPVEFARECLRRLAVYPEPELEAWFRLFRHGELPGGPELPPADADE